LLPFLVVGGFPMPTKRTPIRRSPLPQITNAALDLFEKGLRLRRRQEWSREIADNAYQLILELGMKPWNEDVFDCDSDTPPDFMRSPAELEEYARSREIRLELEAALRAKRKAAREAGRAQKAAKDAPDQPTPPPAS